MATRYHDVSWPGVGKTPHRTGVEVPKNHPADYSRVTLQQHSLGTPGSLFVIQVLCGRGRRRSLRMCFGRWFQCLKEADA